MAVIDADPEQTAVDPGYRGFLRFCDALGFELQPYMRRIARAAFGPTRELVIVFPKGNYKTTICSLLGLHHLCPDRTPRCRIGAGVRQQAEICLKRMKGFARHDLIRDRLTITYFELRDELGGDLTVLAGAGERLHGTSPSLLIGDEVLELEGLGGDARGDGVDVVETAGLEADHHPTAAPTLDGPLGRLRRRAMAQKHVQRDGVVTESIGAICIGWNGRIADDEDPDDLRLAEAGNPAAYITVQALRKQKLALRPTAWRQFHSVARGVSARSQWLAPAPGPRVRATGRPRTPRSCSVSTSVVAGSLSALVGVSRERSARRGGSRVQGR